MLFRKRPKLSVIVNAYNMARELPRTLYSLSLPYQKDINAADYEVIVVENGSSHPVDAQLVRSFGANFHYYYLQTGSPSPCKAINQAVQKARGEWIMCCIDGARILSPRILSLSLQAATLNKHTFIYTLGMHLGAQAQNIALVEGYNQQVEDALLQTVDWQADGYQLFKIASLALSSHAGYFAPVAESNCFCLSKHDYLTLGGLDEAFDSPGGGLVNLDFFNRVQEQPLCYPICLLGEATFHQFHGGVATNVSLDEHPWAVMDAEYQRIRGKCFESTYLTPLYIGYLHELAKPFT